MAADGFWGAYAEERRREALGTGSQDDTRGTCAYCGTLSDDVLIGVCADCVEPES